MYSGGRDADHTCKTSVLELPVLCTMLRDMPTRVIAEPLIAGLPVDRTRSQHEAGSQNLLDRPSIAERRVKAFGASLIVHGAGVVHWAPCVLGLAGLVSLQYALN